MNYQTIRRHIIPHPYIYVPHKIFSLMGRKSELRESVQPPLFAARGDVEEWRYSSTNSQLGH